MKTGLDAVRESIERAKAKAQSQLPSRGLNYFSWKDGEKKILRFLTDEIITAQFYEFICGNDGRPHDFLYSPDVFGQGSEDFVVKYGGKSFERGLSGPLVDPRLKERTVAIAALRAEIPSAAGRGLTTIDHTYDQEVDGKSYKSRWFGIVKQATGNFWSDLIYVAERYDGSLCKRDWEVTREGGGLDTKYHFIAMDPDPDLKEIDQVQKFYGYGKEMPSDDPDRFLFCPQTLDQWAKNYAGEDRVKFWLTSKENGQPINTSGMDEFAAGTTHNPNPDEAQAQPPSATEFADLKDRLSRYKDD